MANKFKEGDRVILTGEGLIPFPDWPVWGSKYSCIGTIVEISHGLAHINWDNGYNMMNLLENISRFDGREENSLSPNISFMLYKRSKNAKGR